tara:strand:+ start:573 stop:1235 length:663 start_codon:yes stop_codon:yes gene_type:complete
MNCRLAAASVGLAALSLPALAGAVVIGDFEGSDPGTWGYWNNGVQTPLGDDPGLEFSSEDASTGLMSVKASNMGYDQNLAYAADFATREAFLNNTVLEFDVIFPEYQTSGFWEVFELVINSNAGFNNVTGNMTNSEGGTNQVGWGPDGGGRRMVTFSVDYSDQVALWNGAVPSYLELVFSLNNDSVHNVAYIDNVRLVPAPGALALGGLAMGGLAVRRRR